MKRGMMRLAAMGLMLSGASAALASEAETRASADGRRGGAGTASAEARYEGDVGFARTDSRSGNVSSARGVAVGLDEDGLSFSISNAIAGRRGIALASNLNITIGLDGEVAVSGGNSVARGPISRGASAGGLASNNGGIARAISEAAARSDRFGSARASTWSESSRGHRAIYRPAVRGR